MLALALRLGLFLAAHKGPDLIQLKEFAGQIHHFPVMVGAASFPSIPQQSKNRVLGRASNPGGAPNRVAFNQAAKHRSTLGCGELFHGMQPIMLAS